jgi:hypothetical protein
MADTHQAAALDVLLSELEGEFPRFRIVSKRDSALCKLIDVALRVVTLGRQCQFITRYHTVLGDTLYVPDTWEATGPLRRVIILRHERVHLRQRRRYGTLLMSVLYLFPILPLGLAWGRARVEWEAYVETLRATAECLGLQEAKSEQLRHHIVAQFTTAAYGWMWPFPSVVGKWYDKALAGIEAELRSSSEVQELA